MNPVRSNRYCTIFSAFVAVICLAFAGCASGTKPTPVATVTLPPSTSSATAPVVPGTANPLAVAFNDVTNKIYVANGSGNTISVIDGTTFKVTDTITVQEDPTAIAVNTTTNMIYVSNQEAASISVIDGTTNEITTTLPGFASQIAVNPVTNRVYVVNPNGAENYNEYVLDGNTNTVLSQLQIGTNASGVAVNTKTNTVYVTNTNTLVVIDGATNKITLTLPTPPAPSTDPQHPLIEATESVAVDETTNTVYFTNGASDNTVDVLDGSNNTVTTSIPVGPGVGPLAVDPLTHMVYMASGKNLAVIDGNTDTLSTTLALANYPGGVAINPAANLLFATIGGQSVGIFNITTDQQIQ